MTKPLAIAFLGPSLPAAEAQRLCPRLEIRGPARQGDVLRALKQKPRAILLIDGVFESQPSVWHQELLVALAEGVQLFGAASMGALRAAELAPFGMVGVGAIYAAYAEGRLTDDADVALLHASAEHEHRPLTVALVNVIATADHAVEQGALSTGDARALIEAARRVHYQDRGWPQVLAELRWSAPKKQRFEAFRRAHPQDAKAADARACLLAARAFLKTKATPTRRPHDALSVWGRRSWLEQQGAAPDVNGGAGLRTLLLADWARSHGLQPASDRVAYFEKRAQRLPLDAGLKRRFAEALALEEQVLRQPGLLLAHAPSITEGHWLEAMRRLAGPR